MYKLVRGTYINRYGYLIIHILIVTIRNRVDKGLRIMSTDSIIYFNNKKAKFSQHFLFVSWHKFVEFDNIRILVIVVQHIHGFLTSPFNFSYEPCTTCKYVGKPFTRNSIWSLASLGTNSHGARERFTNLYISNENHAVSKYVFSIWIQNYFVTE